MNSNPGREQGKAMGGMTVTPLSGALGCEVAGVDLAQLDDATFAQIHAAFLAHSVVVFHDQRLDEAALAAFGRRFGKLEDEPFLPLRAQTEGVYQLRGAGRNEQRLSTQNLGWHVDHSYQRNPSLGAVLYAVDVPEAGGDTLFANMMLAFDGLSAPLQRFLTGLTGIHDVLHYGVSSGHHSIATQAGLERLAQARARFPQTEHPLVCTHPETGRRILYINKGWTSAVKELHPQESRALLAMLNEHALQPTHQCRVRYRNGTVCMWDNRCVQHSPNSDYTGPRHMLRVALHSDWIPS
ncbi:MAG: TauD/TfdA dioxygenase family protein [Steroidobacteraceae bacterium]